MKSRTPRLWLLYLDNIGVSKLFIHAERSSNWMLHLQATQKMLNLFAATGHSNYAKCTRLYLQEMYDLPEQHPWLHEQFMKGFHTISRSHQNWTSIWTDLAIEQTLMRAVKSRGGLTQGRNFTENVFLLWARSLNSSARVCNALTELTETHNESNDPHKERGFTRRQRDFHDCNKFYVWLKARNPFLIANDNLYSLSTGIVSVENKDFVNCEKAEQVGREIQKSFDNTPITKCTLKRKDVIRPISSLINVKSSKNANTTIDHQVMFVRLTAIAYRIDSIKNVFDFELTAYPLSLFKEGVMRKPDKPSLLKVLMSEESLVSTEENCSYTEKDGSLIPIATIWVLLRPHLTKLYDAIAKNLAKTFAAQ